MKIINWLLIIIFCFTSVVPPRAYAQAASPSVPGQMVPLSVPFAPAVLKGLKVYPDNPFRFDFILDPGSDPDISLPLVGKVLAREERDQGRGDLKDESTKLIRYFMASLTIPEKDLWVNLSPYEQSRVITPEFGQTEMGRDLLAQDYLLKQITASVIYPEGKVGKKFWAKVYQTSYEKYGTTNIPVDTFNKVWITPDKAVVYENGERAFVVKSSLKVMLEADYLATVTEPGSGRSNSSSPEPGSGQVARDVIRSLVIPVLEKEVNEGKNFASLRQVYQSLILAAWFKKKIKASLLSKVYVDQKKIVGVNIDDPDMANKIWSQYVEAFKKGAYNYIKEEYDPLSQETIPRKYFSGGVDCSSLTNVSMEITHDAGQITENSEYLVVESGIKEGLPIDAAELTFLPIDPPVPTDIPVFDRAKAQAWVDQESDPVWKRIKQKFVASVRHVTFKEFLPALEKTLMQFDQEIGNKPYALFWWNKVNASDRWVYELARKRLVHEPAVATYYDPDHEKHAGFPTLDQLIDKGINTFVLLDDASYSGLQMIGKMGVIQRYYAARSQADPRFVQRPQFIVVVPFLGMEAQRVIQRHDPQVKIIFAEQMPAEKDLLSPEELIFIEQSVLARKPSFDLTTTLTYFDHRLPDPFSFEEIMTQFFDPKGESPYASQTFYRVAEKAQFDQYKKFILSRQQWTADAAERLEAPVPKNIPVFDDQAAQRWIKEEPDPEFGMIKEKLIKSRRHVIFAEFRQALDKAIVKLNEAVRGVPHAFLWDYKHNSSKRWVYELARNKLAESPVLATYFSPSKERMAGFPTIKGLFDKGVKTFVIMDDASYSAEQIIERAIKPVMAYFEEHVKDGQPPRFIVVVPFLTSVASARIMALNGINADIEIISSEKMPILNEILSDEEKTVIEKRGNKLDLDEEDFELVLNTALTSFDHLVADDHSFPKRIAQLFTSRGEKPYGPGTPYALEEERQFDQYWKSLQDKAQASSDVAQIVHNNRYPRAHFDLPPERFGDQGNLIDILEKSLTEALGHVPVASVFGSLTYAFKEDGTIDWDNVGDIDVEVYEEQRKDFPGGYEQKVLHSIKDLQGREYRIHVFSGTPQYMFGYGLSQSWYKILDYCFGDMARLNRMLTEAGEEKIIQTSLKWYRLEMATLKSNVRMNGPDPVSLKKMAQFARLIGRDDEARRLLADHVKIKGLQGADASKDIYAQQFQQAYERGLQALDVDQSWLYTRIAEQIGEAAKTAERIRVHTDRGSILREMDVKLQVLDLDALRQRSWIDQIIPPEKVAADHYLTIYDLLDKKDVIARSGGYALGLSGDWNGRFLQHMCAILGLTSWRDAYWNLLGTISSRHMSSFMNKVTLSGKPVFFFLPETMEHSRGELYRELEWLKWYPDRLKNVYFVFGLFDVVSESDTHKMLTWGISSFGWYDELWKFLLAHHTAFMEDGKAPSLLPQDSAVNGGIDLKADRLDLQVQNAGGVLKFNIDPAMIERISALPGLAPVVIDIKPLSGICAFLGINN